MQFCNKLIRKKVNLNLFSKYKVEFSRFWDVEIPLCSKRFIFQKLNFRFQFPNDMDMTLSKM